jgi:hypothetical protein
MHNTLKYFCSMTLPAYFLFHFIVMKFNYQIWCWFLYTEHHWKKLLFSVIVHWILVFGTQYMISSHRCHFLHFSTPNHCLIGVGGREMSLTFAQGPPSLISNGYQWPLSWAWTDH